MPIAPEVMLPSEALLRQIARLRPGESFALDRQITAAEFCACAADEGGSELIDGVVYRMPPPTDAHEALAAWLLALLQVYVQEKELGQVRGGRSGVQTGDASVREPDLVFFGRERLSRMTARGIHGAPDLAVEIVDSADARRIALAKLAEYTGIAVAECWVIDLQRREVLVWPAPGGGPPAESAGRLAPGDVLHSVAIAGFRLEVDWLFQGPNFPRSLGVALDLLA